MSYFICNIFIFILLLVTLLSTYIIDAVNDFKQNKMCRIGLNGHQNYLL